LNTFVVYFISFISLAVSLIFPFKRNELTRISKLHMAQIGHGAATCGFTWILLRFPWHNL